MAPGNADAWDDGPRGYRGDDDGYGYGPDGGYPGQYGDPYAQQPYGGYGSEQGHDGGYSGPQGYQGDDYGYDEPAGREQPRGYDQQPSPGYYGPSGGYQDSNAGYGQSGGYPVAPADGYPAPRRGGSGGSGAYPALPSGGTGGYPVPDAGNDWYGGQPAAASGASFADTGTYALNGRVIDEYGTGPRGAMRDPVRGYPPSAGQQGTGPVPVPVRRALPAPPASSRSGAHPVSRSGAQSVAETRQQARLDEPASRPSGGFRGQARGGFPGTGSRDGFDGRGGKDDYRDDFDALGAAEDPYQDQFEGGRGRRPRRSSPRGPGGPGRKKPGSGRSGKRLLFSALAVVAVGIIGVAAYLFVLKPSSPSGSPSATGPLPTGSAQPSMQACQKQLGTYCHIETAADDPKPLTVAELFPPAVTDNKAKVTDSLVSTKLDTKCANAVVGQDLINALQAGKCTQVVRASYVSSDNKIMGTIGVVNLSSTTAAQKAGKNLGTNDFIAPLTSAKGVASKLGNGTGVVEADVKGHYLILTWSEYVNGTVPSTKAQDDQLEQFSSDLVSLTVNPALSQRMVTGAPATTSSAAAT